MKRLKTTITQLTASPGQTGLGVIPQILLQASDPPAPSFRVKAGKSCGKVAIFILLRWHSLRLISSKLGPLVGSRSFNIGVGSPEEGIPSQNHLGLASALSNSRAAQNVSLSTRFLSQNAKNHGSRNDVPQFRSYLLLLDIFRSNTISVAC